MRRIFGWGLEVSELLPLRTLSSQDSKSRAKGPALVAFSLNYYHSAARFQSRPGPPHRGGPVHFSLDGERSGGVPSHKGQRRYRWGVRCLRLVGDFSRFGGGDVGIGSKAFCWMRGMSASIRAHIRSSRRLPRID